MNPFVERLGGCLSAAGHVGQQPTGCLALPVGGQFAEYALDGVVDPFLGYGDIFVDVFALEEIVNAVWVDADELVVQATIYEAVIHPVSDGPCANPGVIRGFFDPKPLTMTRGGC